MSGQPYRYSTDPARFRQDYLDVIALQSNIDDMNYQANKTYNSTKQLPAISQMPDTRSTTDILADTEKLKLSLIGDLKPIMDTNTGAGVVQRIQRSPLNADGSLLVFFSQRAPELVKSLQKMYKFGVKGDQNDIEQMVLFIEKSYTDNKGLGNSTKSFFDRPTGNMAQGAINDSDIDALIQQLNPVVNKIPIVLQGYVGPDLPVIQEILPRIMLSLRELRDSLSTAIYREITQNAQQLLQQNPNIFLNQDGITADYKIIQDIVSKLPRADTARALVSQLDKSLVNKNPELTINILREIEGLLPTDMDIHHLQVAIDRIRNPAPDVAFPVPLAIQNAPIQARPDPGNLMLYPPTPAGQADLHRDEQLYREQAQAIRTHNEQRKYGVRDAQLIAERAQPEIDRLADEAAYRALIHQSEIDKALHLRPLNQQIGQIDGQALRIQQSLNAGTVPVGMPIVNPPYPPAGAPLDARVTGVLNGWLQVLRTQRLQREMAIADYEIAPLPGNLPLNQPNPYAQRALHEASQSRTRREEVVQSAKAIHPDVVQYTNALERIAEERADLRAELRALPPGNARRAVILNDLQVLTNDKADNERMREQAIGALRQEIKAGAYPTMTGHGLEPKRRRGRPKGSGIAHPFVDKVDKSRGISPSKRYISFGKYLINTNKLNDDVIAIKRPSGANIVEFPSNRVSKNLSKVVKTIVGGGQPSYGDINALTEDEKHYLYKVSKKAEIADKIAIPTPSRDQMDRDINQFEIMKGELMSGNDSKELVHKFKALLIKLSKNGSLPKNQVNEIMSDLLQMGF